MEAAMLKTLMPLFEKILDKIFSLFDNAASGYNDSAKTSEDLDKFVKEAQGKMGEFEKLAKQIDPNFKISGDADSSSDFREIVKVLEQMKTHTTDKSELASIDSQIKAFTDAANQMDSPSYKGDKGDADLKITSPVLNPVAGSTVLTSGGNLTYSQPSA
jgi:uncharacterized coiled-coil DUF342 family protein